ncbi:Glycosyltransferase involved in cell wall bisynthesis [Zhouia amylolytica]|uniref:Glycosyltransferase involved in cell wall bisynthesis n=1 Tax=Zhouia amylolytica TaxID=376730 RepID=A0A1I6QYC0_9FLAO|nr:glycosyltransferase [Zhouia amylolytica]SFS57413.1 Glycosyltransferase involved in cell wall bisynthesis [Zhouia amylolytica]
MSTILIIGYVWPEPSSSAAGSRMMQLIRFYQAQGMQVVFCSPSQKTGNEVDLSHLGVMSEKIELNNSSFDDYIKSVDPDIVMFDRYMMEEQFGWRVSEICPSALRVLDTEDLHFLRKARHQAFKTGAEADLYEGDLVLRELASIYRSDLTLIISEIEFQLLKNVFNVPEDLLLYIPFVEKKLNELNTDSWVAYEQREHFMFIGNFLHAPNWDAVLNLKQNIWPSIKKQLPKAELHIYGAYASQKVYDLNNKNEGFLIKGRAKNVQEVMQQARVCLAPLRFGAGLKGKLIDAMRYGTPSVTTSIGAEGINEDIEWSGFVEDESKFFVEKSIELYLNKEQWIRSQQKGMEIINSRFEFDLHFKNFDLKIQEKCINLSKDRKNNIIGRMLNHQTMLSYKYMAKWIEEKNKN